MSKLCTVRWVDFAGRNTSTQFWVDDAITPASAALLAFIQDLQDASEARVDKVSISEDADLTTIVGRVATSGGAFSRVDDQAVLSLDRIGQNSQSRVTVPAPEEGLFMAAGAYAEQDVNPAAALTLALIATGLTANVLRSPTANGALTFLKGWRKGQHHS